MKPAIRVVLAALCLVPSGAALAHHSYAMFYMERTLTVQGEVVRFKWQNPHAFIELNVTVKGKPERWQIEMTSPNNLANSGWKRTSLKAGEKVSIKIHPLRDKSKGGSFVAVKMANGSTLGEW